MKTMFLCLSLLISITTFAEESRVECVLDTSALEWAHVANSGGEKWYNFSEDIIVQANTEIGARAKIKNKLYDHSPTYRFIGDDYPKAAISGFDKGQILLEHNTCIFADLFKLYLSCQKY